MVIECTMGQTIAYLVSNLRQSIHSKCPQINQSKQRSHDSYGYEEWKPRSFTNSASFKSNRYKALLSIPELESFPETLLDLIIEFAAPQCHHCDLELMVRELKATLPPTYVAILKNEDNGDITTRHGMQIMMRRWRMTMFNWTKDTLKSEHLLNCIVLLFVLSIATWHTI